MADQEKQEVTQDIAQEITPEAQQKWIEELQGYSTACISDAMDMYGINGGLEGIRPLAHGLRTVGPAYTLRFEPIEAGEFAPAGEFIDEVPAGSVVVVANGGRTYCTVWGDLLTYVAQEKGIKGTVIDGCCRDATAILETGYPLFSKSAYMKSGKNRVKLVAKQGLVLIGDTVVEPGDIVCADDAGVIVIPQAMLERVTLRAREIEQMESEILADLRQGMPMKEARIKHRYNRFALQVQT